MAGLSDIMKYTATLAQYEEAKASGLVTDDVFVIILEDKVIKFQGYTIELGAAGGGGGSVDSEMSDTSENAVQNKVVKAYVDDLKEEVIDNEEVAAGALAELNERTASIEETIQNDLISNELLKEATEEINEEVLDNEETVAAALGDLNKRVASLFADLVNQYAKKLDTDRAAENTRAEMLSNEEVTAYGFAVIDRELEDIKRRIYLLETR